MTPALHPRILACVDCGAPFDLARIGPCRKRCDACGQKRQRKQSLENARFRRSTQEDRRRDPAYIAAIGTSDDIERTADFKRQCGRIAVMFGLVKETT